MAKAVNFLFKLTVNFVGLFVYGLFLIFFWPIIWIGKADKRDVEFPLSPVELVGVVSLNIIYIIGLVSVLLKSK